MRSRKQVDLTNVQVDFSSVKSRNAHTSLPVNSSDTHTSVIASLLTSQAGNNDNNEETKEPLILQAFDPAMQSYLNRHAQQAKGRRRNLFSSVQSSSTSVSSVPEMQKSNNNINSTNNNTNILVGANSNNHISNNSNSASEQSTAVDFIKQIDSVTNAVQQQQRLQKKYEQALQTFIHGASLIAPTKIQQKQQQQLQKQQSQSPATQSLSAFPSCFGNTKHSMLSHLFADGVPDVQLWDRWALAIPRYGNEFIQERFHRKAQYITTEKNNNNIRSNNNVNKSGVNKTDNEFSVDYVITPVLPESHYTLHYQYSSVHNMSRKDKFIDTMKTKSQLRAQRRDRLRAKQQKQKEQKLKMQAAINEHKEKSKQSVQTVVDRSNIQIVNSSLLSLSSLSSSPVPHDRLSTKNLTLNLFTHSVLNPLATEKAVLTQYEQRYLQHQRRNHGRHVAAIPAQIAKRARDLQSHAIEDPFLRVYRIYPIYSPSHLAKIRHYANDNLLRGLVLWINQIDALVILCGGEVALRHLDKWIMNKMKWQNELTRARRVCTVPLLDAHTFSFHLKPVVMNLMSSKASQTKNISSNNNNSNNKLQNIYNNDDSSSKNEKNNNATSEREAVYMNFVDSIEEGVTFLQSLPANKAPWHDLSVFWRAAFMQSSTM